MWRAARAYGWLDCILVQEVLSILHAKLPLCAPHCARRCMPPRTLAQVVSQEGVKESLAVKHLVTLCLQMHSNKQHGMSGRDTEGECLP